METICAILEQQEGRLTRLSWETLSAAAGIGSESGYEVEAVLLGRNVSATAHEVSRAGVARVLLLQHALLEHYTADGFCIALEQFIKSRKSRLVLLPHSYQVRDFAPRLAARLGSSLLSDCTAYHLDNNQLVFTRQLFQGRVQADLSFEGEPPYFVSIQAGSFPADDVQQSGRAAPMEEFAVQIDESRIRTKPLEKFQGVKRTVDLAKAEIIVAAGRGIKEQEHLELIQKLADALGGEVGGSRPVCDNGWLPMERQIGSSGQTVAPKLYVAVGISGAIQHVVGMKGSRTVVAINRDPNAPIFDVADYGIVGNLFDVLPPLIEAVQAAKGR